MANAWLTPILDQMETILQTNFNTELATIDNTLTTLDNDNIIIEDPRLMPSRYPWLQIWPQPLGENPVESFEIGDIKINWNIVTVISIVGSASKLLVQDLDSYMTAMAKTIIKGTATDNWTLDGKAEDLVLTGITFAPFDGGEESEIAWAGFLTWNVIQQYDATS